MTERVEFILILILVAVNIITYLFSVICFTRKKEQNIYSVIAFTSIVISLVLLITFFVMILFSVKNNFTFVFLIFSSINIYIYLFISSYKRKEIHDVSCYDFPFNSFEEFKKHMRKELKRLEYEEDVIDKNFIIYKRMSPFLEARAICYVKKLDKVIYKKVITQRVSEYFNEDKWLLWRKGINISIMIYTNDIEDYREVVTRVSVVYRKGPTYLTLPVVIDSKKKKLYICDNDKWDAATQKRLAYKTLNHIYRTFLEEE